jgi:hypothetical protein
MRPINAPATAGAVAVLLTFAIHPTTHAMQRRSRTSGGTTSAQAIKRSKPAFHDFKIPAGTSLTIQLGTDASSGTSRLDDPVVARLTAPLISDDTELVPAGTPIFGSVKGVTAASRDDGPGRLEVMFNLIEHPQTRSRVGIRTTTVRFAGQMVKTKRRGFSVTRPADVRVEHGTIVSATLLEPFVVRLPVEQ